MCLSVKGDSPVWFFPKTPLGRTQVGSPEPEGWRHILITGQTRAREYLPAPGFL